jgi:foldase protein PrsA
VRSVFLYLSLFVLILSGQSGFAAEDVQPELPQSVPEEAAPAETTPAPSESPPGDVVADEPTPEPIEPLPPDVVAVVNGKPIPIDEFHAALAEQIGDAALDFLLTQTMIEQELRAKGLEIDRATVEARLEAIESQIAPMTLDEYVRSTGLTNDLFQSVVRSGIGTETLMRADLGIEADAPLPSELSPELWFRERLFDKAEVESPRETRPDGVAAIVNGEKIPTKKWLHYCRELVPDVQEAKLVQQLVDAELVRQQLQKANIVISGEDAERELAIHEKLFEEDPRSGDMSFDEYLKRQGKSKESLKGSEEFLSALGAQRLLGSDLSEEEIQEYFEKQKERLGEGMVRAQHILISYADQQTRLPDYEKAFTKIKELRTQIENGADFSALAAANSEDPGSGGRGGDLGYFRKADMIGPFAEAAFSLKKEELSQPVKTQYGYHLIKVIDIIPPKDVTLDDFRERIVREMVGQRRQAWLLSLRMSADIRKNTDMFESQEQQ